jgi:indole-3-glycerol phosphate synthase
MPTILDKIVADKKEALERSTKLMPLSSLLELIAQRSKPLDFAGALRGKDIKLIAEVKKVSPSAGLLRADFDPAILARTFAQNGASAISVLTEEKHFQGSLEHLSAVREAVGVPLLRKDFVFDDYQLFETAAYGADAVLLIVSILKKDRLKYLLALARSLGLASLVEAHNEKELMTGLQAGAGIIGINNRNLKTLKVNTDITRCLRSLVPEGVIVVSESGIRTPADMKKIRECKVDAVLVGEAFATAADIPAAMKGLMS